MAKHNRRIDITPRITPDRVTHAEGCDTLTLGWTIVLADKPAKQMVIDRPRKRMVLDRARLEHVIDLVFMVAVVEGLRVRGGVH